MIPVARRHTNDGERGAVIIITALAMVAVVIITAIVIDLGYTRGGAGFDQSSVDLAALAGGDALVHRRYGEACQDTVKYININARPSPGFDPTTFCAAFSGTTCSGGSSPQTVSSATGGSYDLTIKFPVSDSEIADASFGAGKADGLPCERMRVILTSRQPSFFGGIVGRSGYEVTRSATVRGGASQTRLVPALWLLDPVGCVVLSVQGGSKVVAGDVSDPANPIPGVITLDSDGTQGCSTTKTTMQVGGTGTEVRAVPLTGGPRERGEISLHALPFDATTCVGSVACKQSEVGSQILPQPIPAPDRATRAPVDWLWNCKATYPDYLGVAIEGCPAAAERGPYMDRLTSAIGASGQPAGFQRWSSFHSCKPTGTITVTGNWWVDCGTFALNNGTTVTFSGGNVVFDRGIKLNGGSALNINTNNATPSLPYSCIPPSSAAPCTASSSSQAGFIYVRAGDWDLGGGVFTGNHTLVYLSPTSVVKGTGGAPPKWTAPTEGPFAGLALWAEAKDSFNISGGAGVTLQGTFFTPYANELSLTGGGNWGQQNAQFISYRLTVSGGSNLTMAPDPTNSASLPPPKATLIR